MPKKIQTDVVIATQTKGMEKALRETMGLNKEAFSGLKKQAEAFKGVQKEIKTYEGQLAGVAKKQADISKELVKVEKGSAEYKKLSTELKDLSRDYGDLTKVVTALNRANASGANASKQLLQAEKRLIKEQAQERRQAQREAEKEAQQARKQARGSFTQGVLQTVGMPSPFLQRGPGMFRQAAGMAVGRSVRGAMGFAGGMGGSMFTGMGGIQQALGSVPIVGQAAAGMLGTGVGFAGQAIDFQRQQLAAAPFAQLSGGSLALTNAKRARRKFQDKPKISPSEVGEFAGLGRTPDGRVIDSRTSRPIDPNSTYGKFLIEQELEFTEEFPGMREHTPKDAAYLAQERERSRLDKAVRSAKGQTTRGKMERLGSGLGLTSQETLQQISQFQQAAGGKFTTGGGAGTAMAAQRLFGLDLGTSGAFGMGARRGGLAGGGNAPEALTRALSDAMKLGLEGSEINTYMQQMASGIQQFQQTGIPVNPESIGKMSQALAGPLTGTRAMAVAGGVQQYVQGLSSRGPQGGLDLMLMQQFGGFSGGGAGGLEQAQIQMESMGAELKDGVAGLDTGGATGDFMRRIMKMGGGGASGRLFLRRQLQKMGVQVGAKEMSLLGKRLTGDLSAEEDLEIQKEMEKVSAGKERAKKISSPKDLVMQARGFVSEMAPNLKKQVEISRLQLSVGKDLAKAVQDMEESAANSAGAFANLAKEPLTNFTDSIVKATKKLKEFTGEDNIWDKITSLFGKSGVG